MKQILYRQLIEIYGRPVALADIRDAFSAQLSRKSKLVAKPLKTEFRIPCGIPALPRQRAEQGLDATLGKHAAHAAVFKRQLPLKLRSLSVGAVGVKDILKKLISLIHDYTIATSWPASNCRTKSFVILTLGG